MPIEIFETRKKAAKSTYTGFDVVKIAISNGVCTIQARNSDVALTIKRVLLALKNSRNRDGNTPPAYEVTHEPESNNLTITGDIRTVIISLALKNLRFIHSDTRDDILEHSQFQEEIKPKAPDAQEAVKPKAPDVQEELSQFVAHFEQMSEEKQRQYSDGVTSYLASKVHPVPSPSRAPKVGGGS